MVLLKSIYLAQTLAVVDRKISELKTRLFRRMQQENTYPRWIDYLKPIVKSLNSEVNEAVGGAPEDIGESKLGAVSYTHLTLPTILLV